MKKVPRDRIAVGILGSADFRGTISSHKHFEFNFLPSKLFPLHRDLNFFSSLNLGILMAFRAIFPSDNPPNIHGEKSRPGLHISFLSSCEGPCLLLRAGFLFLSAFRKCFFSKWLEIPVIRKRERIENACAT